MECDTDVGDPGRDVGVGQGTKGGGRGRPETTEVEIEETVPLPRVLPPGPLKTVLHDGAPVYLGGPKEVAVPSHPSRAVRPGSETTCGPY